MKVTSFFKLQNKENGDITFILWRWISTEIFHFKNPDLPILVLLRQTTGHRSALHWLTRLQFIWPGSEIVFLSNGIGYMNARFCKKIKNSRKCGQINQSPHDLYFHSSTRNQIQIQIQRSVFWQRSPCIAASCALISTHQCSGGGLYKSLKIINLKCMCMGFLPGYKH